MSNIRQWLEELGLGQYSAPELREVEPCEQRFLRLRWA